ncbi:hypothetical protein [Mycolicibacterium vanbaalenii]|nr:hypothetical protein [Mycolicibacterium vanbaalenii]MCV7126955.1 hypothetical protein [Mycolicibacterium vanbaalenii PYR-1]
MPEHFVCASSTVKQAGDALRRTLPDLDGSASESTRDAVGRALGDGAFSQRDSELELVVELANAYLPAPLREQIRELRSHGTLGLLRVLPPPSAYAAPWELLPVDDAGTTRIIDAMDVVYVAPPLTRDGTDGVPAAWDSHHTGLRIVDPEHPQPVLARFARLRGFQHATRYDWPSDCFSHAVTSPFVLSKLRSGSLSHLLWVGHVGGSTTGDGVAALLLKDDELSAATLFNELGWQHRTEAQPAAPARVGLVACRSGVDFSHVEPFGLVVAFLEAGAEWVTATRWTLPTDRAVFEIEHGREPTVDDLAELAAGPFNAAAHAVDDVLNSEDPIRALGDWQRERLDAWRAHGRLVDSPIIWASLANYHAPDRTVRISKNNTR